MYDSVCVCVRRREDSVILYGRQNHMDTCNWLDRMTACLANLNIMIRE